MSIVAILVFLVLLYWMSSLEEWFTHKYLMHQKLDIPWFRNYATSHMEHHLAVNPDFTLKNKIPDQVCFEAITVFPFFVVNSIVCVFLFHKYLKWYVIIAVVLLFALYAALAWNTIHSYIHHSDVKMCKIGGLFQGPVNKQNPYMKWAVNNHQAHHYFKGNEKGNYNVVFPGTDFLFGTHKVMPEPKDSGVPSVREVFLAG